MVSMTESSGSSTKIKGSPTQYSGNEKFGDESEINFTPQQTETILKLARTITSRSEASHASEEDFGDINPFIDTSNPRLNPNDPEFSAQAWAEQIMNLNNRDSNNTSVTCGVSFKDLGAYGYGTESDYQKTVFNILIASGDMIKRMFGNKRKQRKVNILQGFDGLVRAGEMCVVLGRPGR